MDIRIGPGPLGRKVERSELDTDLTGVVKYVGSDAAGEIASSTSETTIATFTIPANTVATGIIVVAPISSKHSSTTTSCTLKLKIGPTGSEVTKQTVVLDDNLIAEGGGCLGFYDSTQTWTAGVTVLVTGLNQENNANAISRCDQLLIWGY